MIKSIIVIMLVVSGLQLLSSCAGCSRQQKAGADILALPDTLITDAPLKISEDIMNEVISNISSPVEMANLFKTSGVGFSERILNNPDNVSRYQTSFDRALNLGVFSANLGYINTFDKNNIVVSYLLAVKTLADGIRVGQFFDFNELRRMASGSANLDSLMKMSVTSFNRMDSYLREQNRSHLSSLIVTGAFIEGLYLASKVVKETGNQELSIRIAEQKDVINILEIILSNYAADPNFSDLVEDIRELQAAYAPIRITRELTEPKKEVKDGILIFIQDEISTVHFTPEDLNRIMDIITRIRTEIVA